MSAVLSSLVNLLFPWSQLLDSALAYAGSAANGATRTIQNTPTRLHFKVVVSAGTFSANNIVATVQTSHDGTTWTNTTVTATFTANGFAEIEVTVPIMTYVRIAYSGTASGTVNTWVMANVDLTFSSTTAPSRPTDLAVNGLVVCRQSTVLRALGLVAATVNGSTYVVPDDAHRAFVTVVVSGRTVGTVVVKLQTSVDGTTWVDADATAALSANGTTIFAVIQSVGTKIRAVFTPGASFDGSASATIWSDGSPFLLSA